MADALVPLLRRNCPEGALMSGGALLPGAAGQASG